MVILSLDSGRENMFSESIGSELTSIFASLLLFYVTMYLCKLKMSLVMSPEKYF